MILRNTVNEEQLVQQRIELYKQHYEALQQDIRKGHLQPNLIDFKRFRMVLDPKDKGSLYTLACYRANLLEPYEVSLFGEMICRNPDCLIIDVGANYGLYTLHACDLSRYGIIKKIIAVEPDRRVFQALTKSVRENGFEEQVILINKAVSDQDAQEVSLFINAGGSVDNRTVNNGGIHVAEQYSIETTTIDSLVPDVEKSNRNLKKIIIKLDIQGNEPLAFRGLSETLKKYSSLAVFAEFDPNMMESEGHSPLEFAQVMFRANFTNIFVIDEITKTLHPIRSLKRLNQLIEECKAMERNDPRRYTNLLCYRYMIGPNSN